MTVMSRHKVFIICYVCLAFVMSMVVLFSIIWGNPLTVNMVVIAGQGIHQTPRSEAVERKLEFEPAILKPVEVERSPEEHSSTAELKFYNFSCYKLFYNISSEVEKAKVFLMSNNYTFKHREDEDYGWMTRNCDKFITSRGYNIESPTNIESSFPLAFNIVFHRNVEQLERLLRVIYRPQNQYCIHVDRKTPEHILEAVQSIANCFDNVFVASKLEIVIYASHTRLLADINCMKDHIESGKDWKYLLNLASSELPIRTNLELVEILTIFNGSNDIHEVFRSLDKNRFIWKHSTNIDLKKMTGTIIRTKKAKDKPPAGLTITKGNAYNLFSRAFVEFALENEIARDLLDWSADTRTPDEHYWATLNNLFSNGFLKTPGGFSGHPDKKPYITRYIGWKTEKTKDSCIAKRYIHNICIFSVEDLPKLKSQHQLIANKFDIEYDPVAYSCMEEWLFNKTRDRVHISNENFYRRLAFVPKR